MKNLCKDFKRACNKNNLQWKKKKKKTSLTIIRKSYRKQKFSVAAHNFCSLRYKIQKEISFHNGSKYDLHFIIKELEKEIKDEFITFLVQRNRELESEKVIKHKIKLIDSFRSVSSPLSSLVDDLAKRVHKDNCVTCSKSHEKHLNKCLIKRFANTHEVCDRAINNFCLMIKKNTRIVWKNFMKHHCLKKKIFTVT